METICENRKEYRKDDKNDCHNFVLLLEICHGTISDILGNFLHCGCTFALLHHLMKEIPGEEQCNHGRSRNNVE